MTEVRVNYVNLSNTLECMDSKYEKKKLINWTNSDRILSVRVYPSSRCKGLTDIAFSPKESLWQNDYTISHITSNKLQSKNDIFSNTWVRSSQHTYIRFFLIPVFPIFSLYPQQNTPKSTHMIISYLEEPPDITDL